jgi:hypothetical protein
MQLFGKSCLAERGLTVAVGFIPRMNEIRPSRVAERRLRSCLNRRYATMAVWTVHRGLKATATVNGRSATDTRRESVVTENF